MRSLAPPRVERINLLASGKVGPGTVLPAMVLHVAWGSPDSTRTTGWMELRRVGSISKLNFLSCKVTVSTGGLAELNVGAPHLMGHKNSR